MRAADPDRGEVARRVDGPGAQPVPRFAEFDALRATAIFLVVTLHAALAYTHRDIPRLLWGVREPGPGEAIDLFCWWAMAVSVPLFFAIAGFFAALAVATRGPARFWAGRVRRVVVPSFAGATVILPASFFAWAVGWLVTGRCDFREVRRLRFADPAIEGDLYGPAHLWFVAYLIPILWAYGLSRRRSAESPSRAGPGLDARWLARWWAPLALAVPSTALMLAHRLWVGVDAGIDRHNAIFPEPLRLFHFTLFFLAGGAVHDVAGLLPGLARRGWALLAASVPVFAFRAWALPLDWQPDAAVGTSLLAAGSGALGVVAGGLRADRGVPPGPRPADADRPLPRRGLVLGLPGPPADRRADAGRPRRRGAPGLGEVRRDVGRDGRHEPGQLRGPRPQDGARAVPRRPVVAAGMGGVGLVVGPGPPGRGADPQPASSQAGSDPAAALIRATTAATRPAASTTSASVVPAPRLNRTDDRSRSAGTPIATSVGDGSVAPLAQAEPSDAATPRQVELHQEGVAVDPREADVQGLREPVLVRRRAVPEDPVAPEGVDQQPLQQVAEPGPPGDPPFPLVVPAAERGGHPDGQGHGGRPGSAARLLAAAEEARGEHDVAADEQDADAGRPVELVGAGRQCRHAEAAEVDRDPADGLHGVGVDRDADLVGEPGELGQRLDRAGLVVGQHQGRQPGLGAEQPGHRIGVDPAVGPDRGAIPGESLRRFEPRHRPGHGGVLEGGGEDAGRQARVGRQSQPVADLGQAEDAQVVGLGPARGEDDLGRRGVEDLADPLAGPFQRPPRGAAVGVAALGVAAGEPVRPHRLQDRRVERRRRVVVEVDHASTILGVCPSIRFGSP